MDTSEVEITYADGWIMAIHSACGRILERYQLGVRLDQIVLDIESDDGNDHDCDSV